MTNPSTNVRSQKSDALFCKRLAHLFIKNGFQLTSTDSIHINTLQPAIHTNNSKNSKNQQISKINQIVQLTIEQRSDNRNKTTTRNFQNNKNYSTSANLSFFLYTDKNKTHLKSQTITVHSDEQSRIEAFHKGRNIANHITISYLPSSQQNEQNIFDAIIEAVTKNDLTHLQQIESVAKSRLGFLYYGKLAKKDALAHHVLAQTIPEPFDMFLVRELIQNTNCKTFVDVGTNTGLYCFLVAYANPHINSIHVFEPQPDCMRQLKETVMHNGWNNKFTYHNCALGDKQTTLALTLAGTGSSFNTEFLNTKGRNQIKVPVTTLDSELKAKNCDFLKIDVEGFELQVLKGAKNVIDRCKPMIFVEIGSKTSIEKKQLFEKFRLLHSHGYKIWESKNLSTKKVDLNWKNTPNSVTMYLALHTEKHQNVIDQLSIYTKTAAKESIKYYLSLVKERFNTKLKRPFK